MTQSYKHHYPFRLATTSFIYPDSYSGNVKRLGALLDEIELIMFESSNLPPHTEINELKQMALDLDITYNVHLPLDVELGHEDATIRNRSVHLLAKAIERVSSLEPTTHTLHLNFDTNQCEADVPSWQQRCMDSISQLLACSAIAPKLISIETLDFAPHFLNPICDQMNLAVCVDVGHVRRYGFDLPAVLHSFGSQVSILHLHGVKNGKDHLSLDQMDNQTNRAIISYLKNFNGSASLEVFSETHFKNSLTCLAQLWSDSERIVA